MIRRLMIANRGEIVCRIARTAREMGISTVGVYSEPDRNAVHADAVDTAVALGGVSPSESYLRGDAIIRAALDTGCDALHPGYGFLAESAAFAQAVIDAGLTWVGPTPAQIALLGDKVAAKRVAVEAGVPTTPVIDVGPDLDPLSLSYPVLVKASAGGGGRGMRIVRSASELHDSIASASREAQAAFGDATVFLEPFIEGGRHVEVQIMGDSFGHVVHFGERDCSIQRRNQKVVEESPSPGITDDVRATLQEGALALARHVGYQNAGTVEYMVGEAADGSALITLLEVNTRLQVEHRVTEEVTQHDLVELQLRIAGGEPLGIEQHEIDPVGHAIEVRIVAEDPAQGWLPSTGEVEVWEPAWWPDDSAVRAGTIVSSDYDSLITNVVAWGADRTAAAARLRASLRQLRVAGISTNLETLIAILSEPDFLAGRATTNYLDQHPHVNAAGVVSGDELVAHLIGVVMADERRNRAADRITGFAPSGWRNLRTVGQRRSWLLGDAVYDIEYVLDGDQAMVHIGAWPKPSNDGALGVDERRRIVVRLIDREQSHMAFEFDGIRRVVDVTLDDRRAISRSPAASVTWTRPPRFVDHDAETAGSGPVSPLPGTVIAVHVVPGQHVSDGELLMVVEAMKMEHRITAHGAATVSEIRYAVGDRVDAGDLLVLFDTPT